MNRLLLRPVGVGHSWADPSKCVQQTHTQLYLDTFQGQKRRCIDMQRRYVNFRWKKFNKGQRLCWNSNNWRKTALQDLVLNMATSGCTIHDGFWHFGEGSGNQFDCNSKVRALRLFWEISRREMQKGARWFYASDSDCSEDFKWSGPTVRRVNFLGM